MIIVVVNFLLFMCIFPTHIIFVFYVCLKLTINFTFFLTNNEGTKVRKQLTIDDISFLSVDDRIFVNWNSENQL